MRVIIQRTKRCSHEVNFVIQLPLTYSLIYGHQKTLSPKFENEKKDKVSDNDTLSKIKKRG